MQVYHPGPLAQNCQRMPEKTTQRLEERRPGLFAATLNSLVALAHAEKSKNRFKNTQPKMGLEHQEHLKPAVRASNAIPIDAQSEGCHALCGEDTTRTVAMVAFNRLGNSNKSKSQVYCI